MEHRSLYSILSEKQLSEFVELTFEKLFDLHASSNDESTRNTAIMAINAISALLESDISQQNELCGLYQRVAVHDVAESKRLNSEISIFNELDPLFKEIKSIEHLNKLSSDSLFLDGIVNKAVSNETVFPYRKKALTKPAHRPKLCDEERNKTVNVFYKNKGNISAASRELCIEPKTLRDRLKSFFGAKWRDILLPADSNNSLYRDFYGE